MSITTPGSTENKAAFERIFALLNTDAFYSEDGAVLYSKPVPGSTITLDQWLQLNRKGEIVYVSRLIQLEDHPGNYDDAEFQVTLPVEQAEALALNWLAESKLEQAVSELRASLEAYKRDYYAA